MSTTTEVTQKDLHDLLHIFEKKPFVAGSCEEGTLEVEITNKCEILFKQDYALIELDNANGVLCPRYPGRIFIPEYEHGHMASTIMPNNTSIFNTITTNETPQQNTTTNYSSSPRASNCSSGTSESDSNVRVVVSFSKTTNDENNSQLQEQSPQYQSSQTSVQHQKQMLNQTSPGTVPATNVLSTATTNTIYEDLYDVSKIRELVTMAKYARCRQRFIVPVIMYRGKYICRSATISVNAETYGRKAVDYAYDYLSGTNYSDRASNTVDYENNDNVDSLMNQALPFSYEEVIKSDIQLLNALNVNTIIDLMVEKRKIKYFMAVSSSEKADPENHYEKFNLLSLPYPGCEFFKNFRDNNYMAKNLFYDWNQTINDANISVPKMSPTTDLNVNWDEYKNWDLVLLTQNYLKACLKYIQEENSGLLIHCISGWDRTPLFISLVRLSLWADGLIHQSLNAIQMTYFTVAYDWYLFGHQLPDRLKRGEDILFFCFHVLKFLYDEEFSIVEHRKRTKTSSSSGSSVIVLKTDCFDDENSKEDLIFGYDQDSNDSISNYNLSMTDNFYATTTTAVTAQAPHNNVPGGNPLQIPSPNPKRTKTSPITVPGSTTRQRHESTSSIGSWQVVTETGSIDSEMNSSYLSQPQQDATDGNSSGNNGSGNNSSNTPSINNSALNNVTNNTLPFNKTALIRKKRLNAVRKTFILAYGQTVGLKFKEGSGMNLATFIGTITDQLF